MKKNLVLLLTLIISTFNYSAYASTVTIGDKYVSSKKMKFLERDHQRAYNFLDYFEDSFTLETGYTFEVSSVSENCDSELYIGKHIIRCNRNVHLEANECGLDDTPIVFEQILSTQSTFYLRVENGRCFVRVEDKISSAGFGSVTLKSLDEKSPLKKYYVKLKSK